MSTGKIRVVIYSTVSGILVSLVIVQLTVLYRARSRLSFQPGAPSVPKLTITRVAARFQH